MPARRISRCAAVTLCMLLLGAVADAGPRKSEQWVGAWGFPPTSPPTVAPTNPAARPPPNFHNVTVRQIVRLAAPAERIRIRFSNDFGDQPLLLGAVHVAFVADDGVTLPNSDHVVTFSGLPSMSIPANAAMLSDPIDWKVPALAKLAISTFVPQDTVPPAHRLSEYVSSAGDFTAAQQMPGAELVRSGALVSEVEIVSPAASRVVVTLGDSITEGVGSTANAFRGWPDLLAERLVENRATRNWSVVNAGIGSNRLLHNNPGKGALARFDRDVLSVPNVAMVLMLEGINDIGYSQTTPAEAVTAGEIIAAYLQIIARSHAHGISIVAGTIPPFEGSHYYDAHGERLRQAVNQWIRTSGSFDGVVEFDAALRDPTHPTQVTPSLHRGDHLHPNDAGYAAMANAIDLKLFTQPRR